MSVFYIYVYVYVCTYVSGKYIKCIQENYVNCHFFSLKAYTTQSFSVFERVLHIAFASLEFTIWLDVNSQKSTCLSPGITGMYHHAWSSLYCLEHTVHGSIRHHFEITDLSCQNNRAI